MLQSRAKYAIQMSELLERNFCDGLEMKFTSPLRGIQQLADLETAAESITPRFTFG